MEFVRLAIHLAVSAVTCQAKRLGGQCRTSTGTRLEGVAMIVPHPIPWTADETLGDHLRSRGVSRREFLQFCGGLAAIYGLDRLAVPRIARALEAIEAPQRRLDPAPGVHRVRRERPSHGGADDRQPGAGSGLARLLATPSWPRPAAPPSERCRTRCGQRRQVSPGRDRLGSPGGNGIYTTIGGRTAKDDPGGGGARAPPRSSRSAPAPTGAASRPRVPTLPAPSGSPRWSRTSRW